MSIRINLPLQAVENLSAVLGLPAGILPGEEEIFFVPRNHREMCQFDSLDDPIFEQAWMAIKSIIEYRDKPTARPSVEGLGVTELKSNQLIAKVPDQSQQRKLFNNCDGMYNVKPLLHCY